MSEPSRINSSWALFMKSPGATSASTPPSNGGLFTSGAHHSKELRQLERATLNPVGFVRPLHNHLQKCKIEQV